MKLPYWNFRLFPITIIAIFSYALSAHLNIQNQAISNDKTVLSGKTSKEGETAGLCFTPEIILPFPLITPHISYRYPLSFCRYPFPAGFAP